MNHIQSENAYSEACRYIPGGVNSPVRAFKSVDMSPVFIEHAEGCRLYDEDGNEYIDYICSWGPMILGHQKDILTETLQKALGKGMSYGLPTKIEVELAKKIVNAYPGVDLVRMVNSGTEATMSAIRVARGYTKRDKVIKFEGCYHGHNDSLLVSSGSGALTFGVPTSPGVPNDIVKNTLVCKYNDIGSVEACVEANQGEIACIIIEPIAGNMGLVTPRGDFLKELRALCTREKIVLIFDEVISGFRAGFSGAAGLYGITPDMACFGKIIGGGLPVGAYGGKKEIMELVSPQGPVYQAGTLSGNPLAMHLGLALLSFLEENQQIYQELEEYGKALEEGMTASIRKYELPFQVKRSGSLLTVFFTEEEIINYDSVKNCDTELYKFYFKEMLNNGIMIAPSQFEAMFISTAHGKEELEYTLKIFEQTMEKISKL